MLNEPERVCTRSAARPGTPNSQRSGTVAGVGRDTRAKVDGVWRTGRLYSVKLEKEFGETRIVGVGNSISRHGAGPRADRPILPAENWRIDHVYDYAVAASH